MICASSSVVARPGTASSNHDQAGAGRADVLFRAAEESGCAQRELDPDSVERSRAFHGKGNGITRTAAATAEQDMRQPFAFPPHQAPSIRRRHIPHQPWSDECSPGVRIPTGSPADRIPRCPRVDIRADSIGTSGVCAGR